MGFSGVPLDGTASMMSITIAGDYFDDGVTAVKVVFTAGEQTCTLGTVSLTSITCTAPAWDTAESTLDIAGYVVKVRARQQACCVKPSRHLV